MIRFEILDGEAVARSLQFGAEPSAHVIKIGRVPSADIRFEHDDQVARMHAMIERVHDGVFVIDLGSPLGTYVNDKKVTKRKLVSGDVVSVGRQKLRVTFVIDPGN
jgi:pSer/pThr/pTyr-binding forkhead associated (FHA) protein